MALFKIREIAHVQIGLTLARKAADRETAYTYRRLTLKALQDGGIDTQELEPFESSQVLDAGLLTQAGTVVIKLFAPINPVVITKETEGLVIPSQMATIMIGQSGILPEYICRYLSQDFVANQLLAGYFGIAQRAITINSLLSLEVRVPSLKNQQAICDYYRNYYHISHMRKELEKEEQKMMRYIFLTLSKDGEVVA